MQSERKKTRVKDHVKISGIGGDLEFKMILENLASEVLMDLVMSITLRHRGDINIRDKLLNFLYQF